MSRPRNGSPAASPSLMAPRRSVMPYWVTIARASEVAFSMSLPAPVVGSWKTISPRHGPRAGWPGGGSPSPRGTAPEHVGQLVEHLRAGLGVLVLVGQHHRVAECPTTRQDRDLVHGVGAGERRGDE